MPSKDFLVVMALIGGLVIAAFIWASQPIANFSHSQAGYVHRDLIDISMAINGYQLELDSEPPLPPEEFFASLEGANPMGITFLMSGKFRDSERGLRCDAWHTPYQVYMSSGGWLIRSAGPNRSFDDIKNANQASPSDDISVFVPRAVKNQAQQDGAGQPPTRSESE